MRKLLITILSLTVFCPNLFAKDIWKDLGNGIYINNQTIKKKKDETVTALFKTYNTDKNDMYSINGINVYYNIDKITAFCNSKTIDFSYSEFYDKNNKLIKQEQNNYPVMATTYKAYVNGEVYFYALCKYKE